MKNVMIALSIGAPLYFIYHVLNAAVVSTSMWATCFVVGVTSMSAVIIVFSPPIVDDTSAGWIADAAFGYILLGFGMFLSSLLKFAMLPEGTSVPLYLSATILYAMAVLISFFVAAISKCPKEETI